MRKILSFILLLPIYFNTYSQNMELVIPQGHSNTIQCYDFSPDSKYIISGSADNTLKLWEVESRKLVKTFTGHLHEVVAVSFSNDGKQIASASERDHGPPATIKLWDINSGQEIRSINLPDIGGTVHNIDFSPTDPNMLLVSYNTIKKSGGIKLWDMSKGKEIMNFKTTSVMHAEFNSDGTRIVSAMTDHIERTSSVEVWSASSAKPLYSYTDYPGYAYFVSFSTDDQYILIQNTSLEKTVINLSNQSKVTDWAEKGIQFRQGADIKYNDTRTLAVKAYGQTLYLQDPDTEERLGEIGQQMYDYSQYVRFSTNDKYLILGTSGVASYIQDEKTEMMVWSLNSGRPLRNFERKIKRSEFPKPRSTSEIYDPIPGENTALGRNVRNFHQVSVLEPDYNGNYVKPVRQFEGHTAWVGDFAHNSDGSKTVTTSRDGTIRIWETATGMEICKIVPLTSRDLSSRDWVVLTPDGRFDASPGVLDKMYYVRGLEFIPLDALYEKYFTPNLLARALGNEVFEEVEEVVDLLPAPLVQITSPSNRFQSPNKTVEVKVKTTDQGGGIDEVLLYHNGKLVQTTQRGFKVVDQDTQSFTITLVDGVNQIKATAFSKQRVEGRPHEISIYYEGMVKSSDLYVLVIGIDQYKNPKYNLNYANADATAFLGAIQTGSQGIFGKVNVSHIQNQNATKANILSAIKDIQSSAGPEDVMVFYYAGHGVMSQEEKSTFYIAPHDVTQLYGDTGGLKDKGISADELLEISRILPPAKQLFVLDACQSGGMVNQLAMRGAAEEKAIAQLARSSGTFWLTASGSEQFATEFAELGHGLFTYTLLEGMAGGADGGTRDTKITIKELSAYLNDRVPELSEQYKGQPQYPNSYGFGQDFPIVIKR